MNYPAANPAAAPHAFTLRQLQYVVAIADTRSFRQAAERCRVAQPSLSAQLAQLEEQLGLRLFDRGRGGVVPTREGEQILPSCRELLRNADDLQRLTAQVGDPFAGPLRLGIIPTISPYLLPQIAPTLHSAFPRLNFLWTEAKTADCVRALQAGELDAAILAAEADLEDLESLDLGRDEFYLVAAKTHALGKRSGPVELTALRGQEILLLTEGHCLGDQTLDVCHRARATDMSLRGTSLTTLVQTVAQGTAITLLPELAIATECRGSGFRVRPFRKPIPYRSIVLVWRRRSSFLRLSEALAPLMRLSSSKCVQDRRA